MCVFVQNVLMVSTDKTVWMNAHVKMETAIISQECATVQQVMLVLPAT